MVNHGHLAWNEAVAMLRGALEAIPDAPPERVAAATKTLEEISARPAGVNLIVTEHPPVTQDGCTTYTIHMENEAFLAQRRQWEADGAIEQFTSVFKHDEKGEIIKPPRKPRRRG